LYEGAVALCSSMNFLKGLGGC